LIYIDEILAESKELDKDLMIKLSNLTTRLFSKEDEFIQLQSAKILLVLPM
jgi:hypothetical protein